MTRREIIAGLGAAKVTRAECPVEIHVDKGPALDIKIPVDRKAILDIAAIFFGRGNDEQSAKIRRELAKATNIKLTLTTECK